MAQENKTRQNREGQKETKSSKQKKRETNDSRWGTEITPEERASKQKGREKGTKKIRRSKRIRNSFKNLKLLYVNIRGLKSKTDSLANNIEEVDPSVICLVETHLDEAERVQLEGFNLIFRSDKSSDSRGIMVAVKDKLKDIAIQLGETKEVGQTLWIRLDNGKEKIRIGTVYAPQESRTRLTELKKLYKVVESHINESKKVKEKLVLVGDFNCKVGKLIEANSETVTKGGRLLQKLVSKHNLLILNAKPNCQGKWTRSQEGKKSVIDYAITKQEHEDILTSMEIDEAQEYTPCRKLNENGTLIKVYTDHCTIILQLNILVKESKGTSFKLTVTHKGYTKYRQLLQSSKISSMVEHDDFQTMYDRWTQTIESTIQQVQTKVKKRNSRIEVRKLCKIKKRVEKSTATD